MMGLRNLYRVFKESRGVTRRRATIGVVGTSPRAQAIAAYLGAQRQAGGAEVLIDVQDGGDRVSLSGKIVDDPGEILLETTDERSLGQHLLPRLARALDKDYLVAVARAYPVLRHAACEEMIRNNARENAFIGRCRSPARTCR